MKFGEKAQHAGNVLLHRLPPRQSGSVCLCVLNTTDGDSLTRFLRIVEANPRKFNLDATELGVRKAFITSTRQVVRVRTRGPGGEQRERQGGD